MRSTIRTCRNGTLSFIDWCWSLMVRLRYLVRGHLWNLPCMHTSNSSHYSSNRKQLCHLFFGLKLNMEGNLYNKIYSHLSQVASLLSSPTTGCKVCFTTQHPNKNPLMTVCQFTMVIVFQMQLLTTRWIVTVALGHLSAREAILIMSPLLLLQHELIKTLHLLNQGTVKDQETALTSFTRSQMDHLLLQITYTLPPSNEKLSCTGRDWIRKTMLRFKDLTCTTTT